ncbi:hypothetical protein [Spirillospora sp. NPDC047279]|uniref:hypothetical protein n=1 Tax=Spirillospora sp. NPDC047279 TaxID=3155478 RepID=UPI0033EE348A
MSRKVMYFVALIAAGAALTLLDQVYANDRSWWLAALSVLATLAVVCGLWLLRQRRDSGDQKPF